MQEYPTTADYVAHNYEAFEQIERETGNHFTRDQVTRIAQLANNGTDFYEAFHKVTADNPAWN